MPQLPRAYEMMQTPRRAREQADRQWKNMHGSELQKTREVSHRLFGAAGRCETRSRPVASSAWILVTIWETGTLVMVSGIP
ncbi:hypothetical protein A0H81_08813 [Grifola frondosa]|uniref:Uncharacterized protein n=1 Tax=Grifola frondosa TaxID=5627 RepID=A0A1C7M3W1_GRIFR|nr:hypothetical protein A0H81_08813 [Grifola frondosa]